MYKARNISVKIVLFIVIALSCSNPEQPAVETPLWSSTNPFTIPVKTRSAKYISGNLVPNPGFESGKWISLDTAARFMIEGWRKVGRHVEWVDTNIDSVYKKNEVSGARHAIKISRLKSSETEQLGDGVMSDFIRVIPGNYELTFDIRLENIQPYLARLGTQLHDAIEIQVQFFDKTKNPINGNMYSVLLESEINYSNKAYPFANYSSIDSMPWSRIRGRSYEPPVMEGIIPNNANYVKLYFGLKGTGTMWVDNIDYRYANNNLSLLEKIEIYNDSILSAYQKLTPRPKSLVPFDTIGLKERFINNQPLVIHIPESNSPFITAAVKIVKQAFTNVFDSLNISPEIKITKNLSKLEHINAALLISLGNSEMHNRYIEFFPYPQLKGKTEGYFIYSNPDLKNIIFIGGNSANSVYYGASTLTQLINYDSCHLYNPRIIDYPSFTTRGCVINEVPAEANQTLLNNLDKISRYKINHVVFDNENAILESGNNNLAFIKTFLKSELSGYYTSSIVANPLLEKHLLRYDTLNTCYSLQTPDKSSVLLLHKYLTSGIDELIVSFGAGNTPALQQCIADNLNEMDVVPFIQAHQQYIDKTILYNKRISPKVKVKFIPIGLNNTQYFNNRGQMAIYYKNIFPVINKSSGVVWGGKNAYFPVIDYIDFYKFSGYFNEYPPIIYSDLQSKSLLESAFNSELFIGNKRLYSLFSPCQLKYLPAKNSTHNHEISFNLNLLSDIDVIRFLTYADYAWNTEDYNPTESIWRILVSIFGYDATIELIYFNDVFVNLLEIIHSNLSEDNFMKFKKAGITAIANLEIHYQTITDSRKFNDNLLLELKIKKDNLVRMFNEKISLAQHNIAANNKKPVNIPSHSTN